MIYMLKTIGILLILISGSSTGWILSRIYLERIKELRQMQLALNILNTEISFSHTYLPEAFARTADALESPSFDIFKTVSEKLKQNRGKIFGDIWSEQLKELMKIDNLKEEDRKILLNWGRQLGNSSLEEQIRLNKLTQKRLYQQEKIAYKTAQKKVKLMRYSGVLLSILIIIILY